MKIGVLALQGAFREHVEMLRAIGVDTIEVREPNELKMIKGLIIPGGESTAIGLLLENQGLLVPIKERICEGMHVFGTCAGLILLAKKIEGSMKKYIAELDIVAKRNAYGRQLGSFICEKKIDLLGEKPYRHVFIRAPYISEVGSDVNILSVVNDKVVAAEKENVLVTAFHPELTDDTRMHEYFVNKCKTS